MSLTREPVWRYRADKDGQIESRLFDDENKIPEGEGWQDSPAKCGTEILPVVCAAGGTSQAEHRLMDLSSYSGLKEAIGTFLNRSDLSDAAEGFITLAEAQMARRFVSRIAQGMSVPRRLVKRSQTDLSTDQEYLAVPSDLLGPLQLIIEGDDPVKLEFLEINNFQARRLRGDLSGSPRYYTIVGSEFQIYPAAQSDASVTLIYLSRLPAIGEDAGNWVLEDYPDAYLYGALTASAPYLKDDGRVTVWSTLFIAAVDDICNADPLPGDKTVLTTELPFARAFSNSALLTD